VTNGPVDHHPTVDHDLLPGHVTGGRGGEEDRHIRDLFGETPILPRGIGCS
jgi:hypothetical protein